MKFTEIIFEGFRNLEQGVIYPGERLNILFGDNAQGKTNFLELIYYLCSNSSFRLVQDRNLLGFGKDHFKIRAVCQEQDKSSYIEVIYDPEKGKKIKINGKKKFSTQSWPRAVLFIPDDLFLLKGPPQKRRDHIDGFLTAISAEYLKLLESYEKLVRKKNLVLRDELVDKKLILTINKLMAEIAAQIVIARINYLKLLEEYAGRIIEKISMGESELKIRYALSFPVEGNKISSESIKEAMSGHLSRLYDKEIKRGSSLIGPHRDDFNIYLGDKNIRLFGSQGQQRHVVVAIKMAQLEATRQITGSYPVFLMDEVMAELDAQRRNIIMDILQSAPYQSFLTSVDIYQSSDINGKIIKVEKGKLL